MVHSGSIRIILNQIELNANQAINRAKSFLAARYCSTNRLQSSAAVGTSSMFPTPWPAV
jgi:hypothetical protein